MDQGAIGESAQRVVEFDLLKNPFVTLRLPLMATKEDIAEAFDDALADGHAADEVLRDARRQLLAPKLRLAATVELLVDADVEQRNQAISMLQDNAPLSDLIAFAKDLPMAARTSFLSNVAQLRPSSGILRYFALTLASIDREKVVADVGDDFETAGLPRPAQDSVLESFDACTTQNIKRLFSAYANPKAAASDMRRCLDEGMASATPDQLAAYTAVVSAYLDYVSAAIGEWRHRIDLAIAKFLANTADQTALGEIEISLVAWDELSQPAQLLSQKKGRDEPQARDLFQKLRGFMIELANEKNAPAAALRMSKVCSEVFAELPRAVTQLKDDLGALQDLVDQEGAKDLIEFLDKKRENLDPLVSDLKRGFGPSATREAKRLYQLFDQAVSATRGSGAADVPWALVRNLALEINNDLGEGTASEALVTGLVSHHGFGQVSGPMKAAIRTDQQVLLSNAAQARFKVAIDKKNTAAARQALVDLAGLATDEAERRQYQQGIDRFDNAKRWRMIKWIFWAVVFLGGIIAATSQNNSRSNYSYSSSTTRPSPPAVAATPSPASTVETKPLAGMTATYSRANVRYCEFESARMDAIDAMMLSEPNRVIIAFNQAVADYNSRCANYEYYVDDMSAVRREIAASSAQINADARATLQLWRTSN